MFFDNKAAAYEKIDNIIKSGNIMCMREVNNRGVVGKIMGVSYTEEGLRGQANKSGRYIYSGATNIKDALKAPKAPNVKVEKFIPSTRPTKEEILWIDKSYRLLNVYENNR